MKKTLLLLLIAIGICNMNTFSMEDSVLAQLRSDVLKATTEEEYKKAADIYFNYGMEKGLAVQIPSFKEVQEKYQTQGGHKKSFLETLTEALGSSQTSSSTETKPSQKEGTFMESMRKVLGLENK